MNRLSNIARSETPGTRTQFRAAAYGRKRIRSFLRDVLAMANAPVNGARYIVTGIEFGSDGSKLVRAVDEDDFSGNPPYQSLIADFIEPPKRVSYQPVTVDGKRIGVYEINDCLDQPYMMRADHSKTLRRGDAYMRVNNTAMKMGRPQLLDLFGTKFKDSVSAERIEIGFPGEIIHKDIRVQTVDLRKLPSAIASTKLEQLIDVRRNSKDSGSTSLMARLVHARLFGSDIPYEDRGPDTLMQEMAQIRQKHEAEDMHFLFETNTRKLQLVVYNQGEEPIRNSALSLVMPNHNAFYVARQVPELPVCGSSAEPGFNDLTDYPDVSLKENSIHVSTTLGDIPTGAPVQVFESPLRICIGSELNGRKLGIQYSLYGSNLRKPAEGKLRLIF